MPNTTTRIQQPTTTDNRQQKYNVVTYIIIQHKSHVTKRKGNNACKNPGRATVPGFGSGVSWVNLLRVALAAKNRPGCRTDGLHKLPHKQLMRWPRCSICHVAPKDVATTLQVTHERQQRTHTEHNNPNTIQRQKHEACQTGCVLQARAQAGSAAEPASIDPVNFTKVVVVSDSTYHLNRSSWSW